MRSHWVQALFISLALSTFSGTATLAQSCNPYRAGYERAIAQGLIKRAGLVNSASDSFQAFRVAMDKGDRIEAAIRGSQYLVIVSEAEGINRADIARIDLEEIMVNQYKKPVAVAVPMFPLILPINLFCPVQANND